MPVDESVDESVEDRAAGGESTDYPRMVSGARRMVIEERRRPGGEFFFLETEIAPQSGNGAGDVGPCVVDDALFPHPVTVRTRGGTVLHVGNRHR